MYSVTVALKVPAMVIVTGKMPSSGCQLPLVAVLAVAASSSLPVMNHLPRRTLVARPIPCPPPAPHSHFLTHWLKPVPQPSPPLLETQTSPEAQLMSAPHPTVVQGPPTQMAPLPQCLFNAAI